MAADLSHLPPHIAAWVVRNVDHAVAEAPLTPGTAQWDVLHGVLSGARNTSNAA